MEEGGNRNIILVVVMMVLVAAAAGIGYLIYQSSQAPDDAEAAGNLVGCVIDNPSVTDAYLKIADEPRCAGLTIQRFEKSVPAGSTSSTCVGTSDNRTSFQAVPGQTYVPEGSCGKCVQIDAHDGARPHGTAKYMGDCSSPEPDPDPTPDPPISCGDRICQTGELCEELTPQEGSRACLPGDIGKAPSGSATPACTFSGTNACKQGPPTEPDPDPDPIACGETCTSNDQCGNGHTCNGGVCTLNTCTTPGNCSDACTPITPGTEVKQCGDTCSTSTECPTGHTCGVAGTCILNACATPGATCSANGCSVIPAGGELPETDLSGEDMQVILLGMLIMVMGVVIYKTGLVQAFALQLLGAESQTNIFQYAHSHSPKQRKRKAHERDLLEKFEE